MKKSLKIFSIIAIAGWVTLSCSKLNEDPKFNDKDAFVSFTSASMSFNEDVGVANIPVTLVSLNGFTNTVSFNIINGTAQQGTDFTVTGGNQLNFTPSAPTQNIQIQIVNHEGFFTGDMSFAIELDNAGSVNMGASKRISVTILDLDHPLTPILGSYTAIGESGFDGEQSWTITLSKDASDLSKVWITNFVLGGSSASTPIYGIVDDDMTEIKVPVHQIIATSSSYPLIRLEGYYDLEDEIEIPSGGFITIEIAADKKSMVIVEGIVSSVYADEAGNDNLGWFNCFYPGVVMTKD